MPTLKKEPRKKQTLPTSTAGKGKKIATPKKVENTKIETKPPQKEKMVTLGALFYPEQAEMIKLLFERMGLDMDSYIRGEIVFIIKDEIKRLSKEEREKYKKYLSS